MTTESWAIGIFLKPRLSVYQSVSLSSSAICTMVYLPHMKFHQFSHHSKINIIYG